MCRLPDCLSALPSAFRGVKPQQRRRENYAKSIQFISIPKWNLSKNERSTKNKDSRRRGDQEKKEHPSESRDRLSDAHRNTHTHAQ